MILDFLVSVVVLIVGIGACCLLLFLFVLLSYSEFLFVLLIVLCLYVCYHSCKLLYVRVFSVGVSFDHNFWFGITLLVLGLDLTD